MLRQGFCFLFLFQLAHITIVYGQQDDTYITSIRHLGVEDGLASRVVKCATQDSRGFVWMGTKYGLNRYDGQGFELYTKEKDKLQSNEVIEIIEDNNGFLWLFHVVPSYEDRLSGQVDLVNVKTWEVNRLNEELGKEIGLGELELGYVARTSDGKIAFYFNNGRVVLYDAKNDKLRQAAIEPGQTIHSVVGEKGIWSLTIEEKVSYVTNDAKARTYDNIGAAMPVYESKQRLYLLATDKIKYFETHVFHEQMSLDIGGDVKAEDQLDNPTYKLPLENEEVSILRWDALNKRVWLYTKTGLYMVPAGHSEPYKVAPNILPSELNGIGYVINVFFSGSIAWFCTTNGVYLVELKPNKFTHYLTTENNSSNQVRALIEDGEGNLLVADLNGLHSIRLSDGKVNEISSVLDGYKYCFDLLLEGDKLWMSSVSLTQYDRKTGQVANYGFGKAVYPKEYLIWRIHRDEEGKMWFGTTQGLAYLDEENEKMEIYQSKNFKNYEDNAIYQFCKAANGETWLPTTNGLYRLDKQRGMVDYHGEKATGDNYLPLLKACHIHEDKDEIFWIATRGYGLVKWDRKTNEYKQFTINEGLSTNVLYVILEDDDNNLWIGSDYGLMKFNKKSYRVQTYTKEHGLTDNEFDRISCYKAKDGKMYLGTIRGVNAFYPEDFAEVEVFDAPLEIQEYRQFSGSKDVLQDRTEHLALSNEIVLQPGDRFFTIKVQLLDYSSAKHNYGYMLEGVDNGWNYTSDNTLRISNIPYGKYTLRVKGQNIAGQWSSKELVIPVVVLAPFYLKSWFVILCIAIMFVAIYVIYKWRVKALESEKKKLESTVEERTVDLKQSLQDKEVLLKEIHHRVKNNLQVISSLLELQSKGIEDEAALTAIAEGKNRVQSIALIHQKLYQNDDIAAIEFKGFMEDLCSQVTSVFGYKVKTEIDVPKVNLDIDTAVPLGLISNELITNSYKYAFKKEGDGKLEISLKETANGQYVLSVQDNGPGLPKEFDIGKANSLGLRLVKRLSKQLGGHVEYHNVGEPRFDIYFKDTAQRKLTM